MKERDFPEDGVPLPIGQWMHLLPTLIRAARVVMLLYGSLWEWFMLMHLVLVL